MTFRLVSGDCLDALAEMPEASVDAVVTDPPYGLSAEPDAAEVLRHWLDGDDYQHRGGGFMGKTWDSFVPGPKVWAECHRVLKPGGHLLAFFGTRTYDLGAMAIRLAGFEVRDCLAWMYGSGFPKSLDVSKAIDKRGGVVAEFAEFRDAVIAAMDERGIKRKDLQHALGNFMLAHYLTKGSQPAVPNLRDYRIIRDFVGLGDQFDELFRDEAEREVVGSSENGIAGGTGRHAGEAGAYGFAGTFDITASATPAAEKWQGWGTALKPAFEPVILARKPLTGTVAANVQEFGTGALNIDGGRVGKNPGYSYPNGPGGNTFTVGGGVDGSRTDPVESSQGRWPANVILDPEAGAMLDEMSGEAGGGFGVRGSGDNPNTYGGGKGYAGTLTETGQEVGYGDTGGASRFFYCAKASRAERNAGLDGFEEREQAAAWGDIGPVEGNPRKPDTGHIQKTRNHHPTVKPIDLMRYLVRLVTPPDGVVLDPFTGSGTTGIAAGLEGFDFIGIEREAEYREIAEARLKWWADQEGDTAEILQRAGLAEKKEREVRESGQVSLFGDAA